VAANVPPDLPLVNGDSQQIEQVLVNLFLNAADALENQGDKRLWIEARRGENRVTITVDDNGPGIPAKAIERIWDPFFTTKGPDKGTGLGLSISKGIVEDHGGSIGVVNRAEGGARFTVELPAIA
jgi:two-component system sensor histidine kinase HupT/HoxJ